MVRQLTDDVCNAVRAEAQQFLNSRPDLSPADLAQYSTLAESTVRSFIRGTIPGGDEVVGEVRRVLVQAKTGEILQPGGRADSVVVAEDSSRRVRRVVRQGTFYETQTVKRVAEVLDFCAENSAIGVITADFGVGKTEAVKAWRRRNAGRVECLVFEFDEFSSCNKVDFVQTLARMLGISIVAGQQNGGKVFRDVCERLKEEPCLLIFDQCETVRPRIAQVVRQIWDRTHDAGVGAVMLAAPILLARMMGGRMADLGALTSRVGIWAPLSGLTKSEMAAIVKQEGIADVDETAFDLWWKACGGSMRRLMRSVDLLRARHSGKRVSEKTIVGVAGHLWGMQISGVEA